MEENPPGEVTFCTEHDSRMFGKPTYINMKT